MNGLVGLASNAGARCDVFQAANIPTIAALAMPVNRHVANFSRGPTYPLQYFSIDDHTATNARADGYVDDTIDATSRAKHMLTQACCIGVIFNEDGYMKMLCEDIAQRNMIPARQIGWSKNNTCLAVQRARSRNTNTCNLLNCRPRLAKRFLYRSISAWNDAVRRWSFAGH